MILAKVFMFVKRTTEGILKARLLKEALDAKKSLTVKQWLDRKTVTNNAVENYRYYQTVFSLALIERRKEKPKNVQSMGAVRKPSQAETAFYIHRETSVKHRCVDSTQSVTGNSR